MIVEIHPKSEISKAHYVAGWGNEERYGGNTHFIVIDKYCEVSRLGILAQQKLLIKSFHFLGSFYPFSILA